MKFMLDTNTCIYIIKQKPQKVLERFKEHKVGDVGISSITLAELQYGVSKSLHPQKNREALSEFVLPLEVADFDDSPMVKYGHFSKGMELL